MLARIDNKLAVRISTVSFHFALGVSAIDRIALSEEGGPVWSALSRRNLDSLIGALTRRSQVA